MLIEVMCNNLRFLFVTFKKIEKDQIFFGWDRKFSSISEESIGTEKEASEKIWSI